MIWTINNKEQEKFLRRKASEFDFAKHGKKEIREIIKNMRAEMAKALGIGLSANQLGMNMKLFVAKTGGKQYSVFNPVITKLSKETVIMEEGCLSVPEMYGEVERPEKVTLEGLDANGKKIKIKAWGLLARIFQHETDHLKGVLFTDTATDLYKLKNEDGGKNK